MQVEVKKSTLYNAGMGLFSKCYIQKGDIITFFGGWRISQLEANILEKLGKWKHIIRNIYNGELFLCADYNEVCAKLPQEHNGGFGQFANAVDAPLPKNPNVPGYKWKAKFWWRLSQDERTRVDKNPNEMFEPQFCNKVTFIEPNSKFQYTSEKIYLVALKPIRVGDEIFCRYGKTYWRKLNDCSFTHEVIENASTRWLQRHINLIFENHTYQKDKSRLPNPLFKTIFYTSLSSYSFEITLEALTELVDLMNRTVTTPLCFQTRLMELSLYKSLSFPTSSLYHHKRIVGYLGYLNKRPVLVLENKVAIDFCKISINNEVIRLI